MTLFLSVKETAAALGVSPITIYRGISSGEIPVKKIGSRQLIPRSWLEETSSQPEPALEQVRG
jgi:excisionase family DNA binding protein